MAINVMQWVWDSSRSTLGARLVLLAIADCASSDGDQAWPSVAEIARKANCGRATVTDAIRKLVDLGELEVKHNQGKAGPNGVTNYYRVIMIDYPPKTTQRNLRRPPTPPNSGGVRIPEGSEFRTRADSAPVRDSEGVRDSAEGVRIPGGRGPNSGWGTIHEPSLTKTSGALTLDDDPGSPAGAGSGAAVAAGRDPVTGRYPKTAQGLVAWWIDEVRRKTGNPEYTPPGKILGHTARLLREMLAEGIPFDDVRRGLQLWWESQKTSSPSLLPSIVNDVMSGTVTEMHQNRPPRAGQAATVTPPTSASEMVL
jgi:Helix-turn-helix domain